MFYLSYFLRKKCNLHQFLLYYVMEIFLQRKSVEMRAQIDAAIQAKDAWKATILLDITTDYKPLLMVRSK